MEALGADVLFLPAPDFGHGPKIGAASWQLAASAQNEHQKGINAFIRFALQDKYLAEFSEESGLIPATASAAQLSTYYKDGGAMEPYFALSAKQGTLRPVTPGYVVQARVFEKAMADIANGADVATALDTAVDEIDADIEKNQGYGH